MRLILLFVRECQTRRWLLGVGAWWADNCQSIRFWNQSTTQTICLALMFKEGRDGTKGAKKEYEVGTMRVAIFYPAILKLVNYVNTLDN